MCGFTPKGFGLLAAYRVVGGEGEAAERERVQRERGGGRGEGEMLYHDLSNCTDAVHA